MDEENIIQEKRDELVEALKYHGADVVWVKNSNIRVVNGKAWIQTQGTENIFPNGEWKSINSILSIL